MRMTTTLVTGIALACVAAANAQSGPARPWQHLQMPTVAEVQSQWVTPSAVYGPEPYYGLNGPTTIESVRRDLDTMVKLGFRAVTVQYGSGAPWAYMSPEYLAFFKQFVNEAKQRGLKVWIVDDAGYPSGFAGGKFSAEHPELRMQALEVTSKTAVHGGDKFDQPVTPDTVVVTAVRASDGNRVTVPVENGRASWTAPEGEWTVYVVEHQFRTSPTRSDTNPHRVKDTSQSLEDYMNPAATAQYLAYTHEKYAEAVGDEFGKTIMGFRGDEPDYSIRGLPWTNKFFATFEAKKGYDIRPWLATLLQGPNVQLTPEELRAKADYYDVFADMFRDGFFKPQGEWCAAHGLEYQVHLNHEERQLELAHSEGDFFRDMKYVEVPGIDTIWHQIWTDTVSDFPRFASSASHVYGHPRAFTESFAAYRPAPDVTQARYIINEQLVRGVNLVETMYFPGSAGGHGGPMSFMRDPAYPQLMHYTSRMSYVLSMGRPTAEVAVLLPAESLWMGDKTADDTFVSTERLLSEHQINFDIVGEDAVASDMRLEHGRFVTASGNAYHAVIVPAAELLPAAVVDRLKQFAAGGGTVLFLGQTPQWIGEKNDLHARKADAAEFGWAKVVSDELPVTPTPPMYPPASAPGPMVVPEGVLNAVEQAAGPGELQLQTPSTAVRFFSRRLKDATVFLLFNESANPVETQALLRVPGHMVQRWDADKGSVEAVDSKAAGRGERQVEVKLAPYEAEMLVVR